MHGTSKQSHSNQRHNNEEITTIVVKSSRMMVIENTTTTTTTVTSLADRPIPLRKRKRPRRPPPQILLQQYDLSTSPNNENRHSIQYSNIPVIIRNSCCQLNYHDSSNKGRDASYSTEPYIATSGRSVYGTKLRLYHRNTSLQQPLQVTVRARAASMIAAKMGVVIGVLLLLAAVVSSTPTFTLCYTQLNRADVNGNQFIDSTTAEWGLVVQYISGGTVTAEELDAVSLFTTTAGSTDSGVTFNIGTVQDPANNHAFCIALYTAILGAASTQLDTTESKCFYAATIGDANRDSLLERSMEFPRYANQISGNAYGFGTSYEELPTTVQSIFDEFVDDATAGTINIVGSKSSETVTTEQATKLNVLCQSTAIAILAAAADTTTAPPPIMTTPVSNPVASVPAVVPVLSSPAPIAVEVLPPVPVTATVPTATIDDGNTVDIPDEYVESYTNTVCLQKIAFSDRSRDNALDKDEYYDFINKITIDAFVTFASFETLPEILRNNFIALSGGTTTVDGTINVLGSKPGQTPTQEDTDRLNKFCTFTDIAIQKSGYGSGGTSPTTGTPPVVAPMAAPTAGTAPVQASSNISYDDCVKSMIIADISRNSLLDGKEFVRFVSRLDTTIARATDELSALSPSIQSAFTTLATSNGEIDVTGSKPNETPTPDQILHLEAICNQVGAALLETGDAPTTVPAAPVSSGSVTINNAFITANTMQIAASALKSGQLDWESLRKAYASFVERSIADILSNRVRRLGQLVPHHYHLRQRMLPVSGVVKDSVRLEHITDTTCPIDMTDNNTLCQVVFASFAVDFIDMNEALVFSTLTNHTQAAIIPKLNETLLSVNPKSAIYIVGPSNIVKPAENTPNQTKPTVPEDGDSSNGPNVVQIIGALVIVGILLGGPIYYWQSRRTKKKPSVVTDMDKEEVDVIDDNFDGLERAPSFRVKSSCTDDDDSDDDDPGNDNDNDDDDSSANDDDAPNKSDQNGKSGGKKFKAFRLGKKKDSSSDDDFGILDSHDGLGPGTDDFENYEFDEPSELFVDQNAENVWGDPQWGNAANEIANSKSDLVGHDSNPIVNDGEEGNEHTEWSRSQSSGTNSAFGASSVVSGASGDNVAQLGGLVDKGQWGGVLQTAAQFHNNLNDSVSSRNSDYQSVTSNKSETETSHFDDNPVKETDDISDDHTPITNMSLTSEEVRRTEMYRIQIEDLVRKTAPDEIGNVTTMMEKFVGREAELINTLQTMNERLVSQRALKAVHKSKAIRARDVRDFASGGAESSAVIAAACMINGEEDTMDYNDGEFDEDGESYYEDNDREESGSGSGSYDDDDVEKYQYDEDNDRSQSYSDDDGNDYEVDRSRSSRNDDDEYEDDRSGRYDEDYEDGQSGRYDDDGQEDSRGSYIDDDNERSQYDDDNNGQEDSRGSYIDDDNDRSQYDDDNDIQEDSRGSYNDDDNDRSQSNDENDGQEDSRGSYNDDDNDLSQYDDENGGQEDSRGSYNDDEDERRQYSDKHDDADDDDHSRRSGYDDNDQNYSYQGDEVDDFTGPTSQFDGCDEDDAFKNEGELFDDEEQFDDDFGGNGSSNDNHSGSKSQSHSIVYDDGDGSYYTDEE